MSAQTDSTLVTTTMYWFRASGTLLLIAQSARKRPSAYPIMKTKSSTVLNQQLFLKLLMTRLTITILMQPFRMAAVLRRRLFLTRLPPRLKKPLRNLKDASIHALKNTRDCQEVASRNANQLAMKTVATAGTLAAASQALYLIVRVDSVNLCRVCYLYCSFMFYNRKYVIVRL